MTAVACIPLMYACGDPYGELKTGYEPKFINVTEVRSDYDAFAATSKLLYSCPEAVSASSNQAWCSVEKVQDGELELRLSVNRNITSRNAMISMRTESGEVVRVPISQLGVVLKLSSNAMSIPYAGGSASIVVDTPIEFVHYASEDWLTYTVDGNTITVTLPEHSGFPRRAFIHVDLPEQKLSAVITVEQDGNLTGLGLAGKFLGEAGSEIEWYFDPMADNSTTFNSAWVIENSSYKQFELKIGRIRVSSEIYQAIRLKAFWKSNSSTHNTGWLVEMVEGSQDDNVVLTLKFDTAAGFWSNDTYFYNNGGIRNFLQNFTGASLNDTKTYRVVWADDLDDPTVMTLRDTGNISNWFTVTKTPVAL